MKIPFVDLQAEYHHIQSSVDSRIAAVLRHGQFILGPEVKELEAKLAARVAAKHCIGCASGTDALLMALMALGVGRGDEVITTPFTFIATVETIALLGARAVFVDIDPRTYTLNPDQLESAITSATKAIVPVSLYGQCADMDRIGEVAAAHHLAVIEDAAQSFGATYKGRPSCNLSIIGCTSFFPSKPLGCYGDGGACMTSDDRLAMVMRQIREHGQDRRYHHVRIGINGRLDSLQAAVLLAKLEVFGAAIAARQEAASEYTKALEGTATPPYVEPHNTSVYAQYTVECRDRDAVAERLHGAGIPTAIHYPVPLHLQPALASLGYETGRFPKAEHAARHVLSLPLHPYLSSESIRTVAEALRVAQVQE